MKFRYWWSHSFACLPPHGGLLARRDTLLYSIPKSVRALGAVLTGEPELIDEVGHEVDKCGTLQEKCHWRLHAEVCANTCS